MLIFKGSEKCYSKEIFINLAVSKLLWPRRPFLFLFFSTWEHLVEPVFWRIQLIWVRTQASLGSDSILLLQEWFCLEVNLISNLPTAPISWGWRPAVCVPLSSLPKDIILLLIIVALPISFSPCLPPALELLFTPFQIFSTDFLAVNITASLSPQHWPPLRELVLHFYYSSE